MQISNLLKEIVENADDSTAGVLFQYRGVFYAVDEVQVTHDGNLVLVNNSASRAVEEDDEEDEGDDEELDV